VSRAAGPEGNAALHAPKIEAAQGRPWYLTRQLAEFQEAAERGTNDNGYLRPKMAQMAATLGGRYCRGPQCRLLLHPKTAAGSACRDRSDGQPRAHGPVAGYAQLHGLVHGAGGGRGIWATNAPRACRDERRLVTLATHNGTIFQAKGRPRAASGTTCYGMQMSIDRPRCWTDEAVRCPTWTGFVQFAPVIVDRGQPVMCLDDPETVQSRTLPRLC